MIGGILRYIAERYSQKKEDNSHVNSGILFCSGMIAGEGLVGIFLAVCAILGINFSLFLPEVLRQNIFWSYIYYHIPIYPLQVIMLQL